MTIILYLIIVMVVILALLFSFHRTITAIYGFSLYVLLAIFIYFLPKNIGLCFSFSLIVVICLGILGILQIKEATVGKGSLFFQ